MSNYNKVLIMGRLTRDPELRYTPQGTSVAEIGIATNREYLVGTERRKDTTFIDVTLWRRQAEVVCQYLKKGAPIFIEGHLSLDTWETPDGQKRSKLKVVAENFQFMGGRQDGDSSRGYPAEEASQGEGGGYSPPPKRPYPSRPAGPGSGSFPAPASSPAGGGRPDDARSSTRFAPPGGSRIPNEAFSPIPEAEGDDLGESGGSDPDPGPGPSESPIGGVEDRDIPF